MTRRIVVYVLIAVAVVMALTTWRVHLNDTPDVRLDNRRIDPKNPYPSPRPLMLGADGQAHAGGEQTPQ